MDRNRTVQCAGGPRRLSLPDRQLPGWKRKYDRRHQHDHARRHHEPYQHYRCNNNGGSSGPRAVSILLVDDDDDNDDD